MADAAYHADQLCQVIAANGAIAAILNNPSCAHKYPLENDLYAERHLIECCFPSSSSSATSRPASRKLQGTTSLSSHSPQPSYGSGKCPQDLAVERCATTSVRFVVPRASNPSVCSRPALDVASRSGS
jgi:hypothetical protein